VPKVGRTTLMEIVGGKLTAGRDAGQPPAGIDPLLVPYLRAATEEEAERLLSRVINEHAGSAINEVIRRKLLRGGPRRGEDEAQAEDIRGDAVLALLARLRKLKEQPGEASINNLRGYAAVVATHACYRYLRRKHPRRHILKDKLRYLLTRQSGFALWQGSEGELVAGFQAWRARDLPVAEAEKFERLVSDPAACVPARLLSAEAEPSGPADLLAAVFNYLGGPLALDDLVDVVARAWGVDDRVEVCEEEDASQAGSAGAAAEFETGEYLRRLWAEIRQLPLRQRTALLLNLKEPEGGNCVALLPMMGVATMRQIAEALELTASQLAELWQQLPLDDARIAERLQLSRQQVINLRKSARERLARRMKGFG
jgi:RNA polymerase sigma factor (sigma-70 family)